MYNPTCVLPSQKYKIRINYRTGKLMLNCGYAKMGTFATRLEAEHQAWRDWFLKDKEFSRRPRRAAINWLFRLYAACNGREREDVWVYRFVAKCLKTTPGKVERWATDGSRSDPIPWGCAELIRRDLFTMLSREEAEMSAKMSCAGRS